MINEKKIHSTKMKSLMLTIVVLKLLLVVHRVHSQSDRNDFTFEASTRTDFSRKDSVVRNYENLTSISEILELFSVDAIGAQWSQIHERLSPACVQHMTEYLSGLEKKELWAIKSKSSVNQLSKRE